MRFHTPQLLQVLARGGFDSRWVCDVFYDGARQMQDVDLEDVKFTEDGTAKVQQSGSLTIIYQGRHGESIAPRGVEDILSPFGTTLNLYMLITDGPKFEERIPMGQFVVSDTPTIQTVAWSFRGRSLTKGDRITVTFKDPFYKVLRNRFDVPGVTPSLASCYAEIQRLTRLTVTRSALVPDGAIPRALVYEEDRLDAVYELGKALDATPYMMADGSLSMRPLAWTDPVDTITAANVGDDPAEITPEGRTPWVEQARNLIPTPAPDTYAGSGWQTSAGSFNGDMTDEWVGVAHTTTVTAYVFTDGMGEALAIGDKVTLAVQYRVNALGASAATHVRITPHIRTGNVYIQTAGQFMWRPIVVGQVETVLIQWTVDRAIAINDLDIALGSATSSGGFTTVGAGWDWQVRRPTIVRGEAADLEPFTGDTNPGGGLRRTRWLGSVNASASVDESREIIPAVLGPRIPVHGTLIDVKRGMSAEGVYNAVVVRATGQGAGVLASGEITEGPLRVANEDGQDSPYGRVPYFLSSQLVTTVAQATEEVRKWLPRVSRPQAVILDIQEIINPLREVGDVVTVKRRGEEFPARVVKVQRSKAKTQTTSVLVVPNGA